MRRIGWLVAFALGGPAAQAEHLSDQADPR